MQQLITGLLFVVQIPLNMFRASLCPSSGAYQLQQPPLVYRRNVVVAVLLAVVGPDRTDHGQQHCYHNLLLPVGHLSADSQTSRYEYLTLRLLMSYIYGAPILDVSRSHTTTKHSRQDSPGRVISSSQRPLPDNTRHSQQTNIHAPGGIRTHDFSR